MRKAFFITFLALVWVGFKAHAQEDSLAAKNLDEVVVTATKTAVSRNNVAYSVSVVGSDEIERSSESALLPVLSGNVPGLFVTERGITGFGVATGSAGQISIRGVGGSPTTQVLVLLNGNPQFMGLMGHPLADGYIASDVQRVEVIRGPASTLYGSNAMGGVINIITRNQTEEGASFNSRVMYGSYNTLKYMVSGGLKRGKLDIYSSFNHDRTDGHRDSSDFSIYNGYIKAGLHISKSFRVNVDVSLARFTASDPGYDFAVAGSEIEITRAMGALSLENNLRKTHGSVRFFYNYGDHDISDGFQSKDNNYGWVWYQSLNLLPGNTITLGVDGKTFGGRATQEDRLIGDTSVWELAGYVFIQQELGRQFSINSGFRLEHHNVAGNEPVPSFGISWRPTVNTNIKASVSKGYRNPTIRELYLFPPANEELKPERVVSQEIGINQNFFHNKLQLELTLYKTQGSNLIKTLINSGRPMNVNSGSFSNTGLEISGRWRVADNFLFTGSYSYVFMETPLISTPEIQASSSLLYKIGKFDVSLSMQNIFNLYLQTQPKETEDYTLLNSRLSYKVSKAFGIFVKLENILDKQYYINYGYPMPGFLAFGGLNIHL